MAQAYADECEVVLDLSEMTIFKSIKAGDSGDAKWYLTKKGKGRGYIDGRQEIDLSNKGDKFGEMSPEQIAQKVAMLLALAQERKEKNDATDNA